jgi:SAM-dependent methyltransferase
VEDAPDIAAGWDLLADAYQEHIGWPEDELSWGLRCPTESELQVVSDVADGASALVLGCGGGQELVALSALGAGPLTGTDPSAAQLRHAATRLGDAGIEATLLPLPAERLSGVPDGSVDLVVSVQALDYVEDLGACFREVRRVLRPGGVLAFSVLHPADLSTEGAPPYAWHTSYFTSQRDWVWDGLAATDVPLRSWFRTPAAWFTAVTAAGLVVERLLEPPPAPDATAWIERGWLDEGSARKLDVVPGTIVLRAGNPGG